MGLRIDYIIKKNNKTVGARVCGSNLSIEEMLKCKYTFENAVVCKNGVIRAKNGYRLITRNIIDVLRGLEE